MSSRRILAPIAALLFLVLLGGCAEEPPILDLAGEWKAYVLPNPEDAKPGELPKWDGPSEDPEFTRFDFDDSDWEPVIVPGDLDRPEVEKKGGYFWYRKNVKISESLNGRLSLVLGAVPDAVEVYWDGKFIGRAGFFLPEKGEAFHKRRAFPLSSTQLSNGEHLLALRGYRQEGKKGFILFERIF